jgi:ribonuclease-3
LFLDGLFRKKRSDRETEVERAIYTALKMKPRNIDLYIKALRHKSAARNIHGKPEISNERLEFLGDTILDAVVAEYLFLKYPKAEEGDLTKMKSRVVSRSNLNHLAQQANWHNLLETDAQADTARESLGGNALEAIVGAMYLDLGFDSVKRGVIHLLELYSDLDKLEYQEADFKSRLFELAHRMKQELRFETKPVKELEGKKVFNARAFLGAQLVGIGEGFSKKKAEQDAAKKGLEKLNGH